MEVEMSATASSHNNNSNRSNSIISNISNVSNAGDNKVSYLSNVESNGAVRSGISLLSSQVTSSSFGSVMTDRSKFPVDEWLKEVVMRLESMENDNWEICESLDDGSSDGKQFSRTNLKICRFCYVEGSDEIEWLRPCKCAGSMLWVHKQCFNSWIGKASGRSKIQCQICSHRRSRQVITAFIQEKDPRIDENMISNEKDQSLFKKIILDSLRLSDQMFDNLKDHLSKRLIQLALWITDDPGSFFTTLFLCITPLLLLTAVLSWKLRKAIEKERRRERLLKSNLRRKKK